MPLQEGGHAKGFLLLIDEPIIGFQFVPISRAAFAIGGRRVLGFSGDNAHEALLSILMTQVDVAELRFHPVVIFQAFFQTPRGDLLAARSHAHLPPPVPLQFVNVDRLGGLARRRRRAPSSSRAGSDPQPVGSLIAGSGMLRGIHEAFQEPRLETVAGRKVSPHPLPAQAQHSAGQILTAHLRANEETRHVDHPFLKALAGGPVPAHPHVALAQTQSAGTETHRSQPAVLRADQIAQLPAHQATVPQGVLGPHQLVPGAKQFLFGRRDFHQPQALYPLHLGRDRLGGRDRRAQPAGLLGGARRRRRRELPETSCLQGTQRHQNSRFARLPAPVL